jgi:cyclopropane fatty-acyl-phospholipid synthase-like methyltransferase
MFDKLEKINHKPEPFEFYTTDELWCDPYVAQQMLKFHLAEDVDLASRNLELVERSCEWIAQRFGLAEGVRVCDFGCGPGLYTTRFAQTGAQVSGVDFSRVSIGHAQKTAGEKGLDINYTCQDYLQYQSNERFDLITLIFCDYCALSPTQRKTLLDKFNTLLAPGGALLLDVITEARFDELSEERGYTFSASGGFWSAGPYYEFKTSFLYQDERLSLDKYTIIEPNRWRRIYNWLQHYSLESLRAEFAQSGFEITGQFSNVAGDLYEPGSPEMAVIAQKAES